MTKFALVPYRVPGLEVTGLPGSVAASRYVGATASGAPTTGAHLVGDFVIDQTGKIWICTVAATPGTWVQVGAGGSVTLATTVQTENGLDAGQVGTSTNVAREDHRHPITNLVDLSTTQNVGGQKTFTGAHALTAGNAAATAYGTLSSTASEILQNITAATSTNKVQLPGVFMQFGQYWDGAATQFWSTSIGSTVDDATGRTRMVLNAGTTAMTGAMEVGTKLVRSGTLSVAATGNTSTVLGQFTTTNGSLALRIHLHFVTSSAGQQRSKTYEFVVDKASDTTATYYKVLPADQSGAQGTATDVFLVAFRPTTATSTWQFWVCAVPTMSFGGTVSWTAESYGDTLPAYAATLSPATSAPTLPFAGTLHPSNYLDTVGGNVGIGTDNPGYPLHIINPTSTSLISSGATSGVNAATRIMLQDGASYGTLIGLAGGGTLFGLMGMAPGGTVFSDEVNADVVISALSAVNSVRIGVGTAGTAASMLRVTASDVQINDNGTARSAPRGLVGIGTVGSATAAFSASTNMATVTVPVVNGRKYRVHYSHYTQSFTVSGDIAQFIFSVTNCTALTNTAMYVRAAATTNNSGVHIATIYQASATGNAVFDMNGSRQSGTGTITVSGNAGNPRSIWVEDIGT